jgi:hypothetical protein
VYLHVNCLYFAFYSYCKFFILRAQLNVWAYDLWHVLYPMVLLHLYLDHLNVNRMNEWMNSTKGVKNAMSSWVTCFLKISCCIKFFMLYVLYSQPSVGQSWFMNWRMWRCGKKYYSVSLLKILAEFIWTDWGNHTCVCAMNHNSWSVGQELNVC